MTSFSLSDLVKRSASQILYLGTHPREHKVSDRKWEGVEYQERMTKKGSMAEMGGTVQFQGIKVHFSWDEVVPGNPIRFNEIKMPATEWWYGESSMLQTAVYAAFTEACSHLDTAKFHLCRTRVSEHLDLSGKRKEFWLKLGGKHRRIRLKDGARLRNHFLDKALLLSESSSPLNYDKVREWDVIYKHKEFSRFERCFETY